MTTWVLVSSLVLGAQLAAQVGDASRIAVLPLEGAASEAQRAEVDGLVRAEVTRLFPTAVLDGDATADELGAAAEMGFRCASDDTPCLTRLAILMRVEQLVAGTLSVDESGARLKLFVISAASAARLNQVDEPIPASGPARLQGIRGAVTLLLAPERVLGTIVVSAPPGSTVLLDGTPMGTAPLPGPLTGVRAGRHFVRVELEGFTAEEKVIDLFAGTELALDVQLQPAAGDSPDEKVVAELPDDAPAASEATGGEPSYLALGMVIAGGVGLVLGGGLTLFSGLGALTLDQLLDRTNVGDYDQRKLMQGAGQGLLLAAFVSSAIVITGGVATGAGLVMGAIE